MKAGVTLAEQPVFEAYFEGYTIPTIGLANSDRLLERPKDSSYITKNVVEVGLMFFYNL